MLIVGSSLNRNLHKQALSHITKCDITFTEAFTINADSDARFPDKNFLKLVPQELKKEDYDVLILNCGPNEVTNLHTKAEYSQNINKWKQKMYLTTLQTYELAEKSLLENPNLKRAIIVKQTPRYDDSVKMYLSDYANQVLEDIWKSKGCPDKIVISSLDLHCDGELRYQRYGDMNHGNYDGVHLRGPCLLYTSPSPRD